MKMKQTALLTLTGLMAAVSLTDLFTTTTTALQQTQEHHTVKRLCVNQLRSYNFPHTSLNIIHSSNPFVGIIFL